MPRMTVANVFAPPNWIRNRSSGPRVPVLGRDRVDPVLLDLGGLRACGCPACRRARRRTAPRRMSPPAGCRRTVVLSFTTCNSRAMRVTRLVDLSRAGRSRGPSVYPGDPEPRSPCTAPSSERRLQPAATSTWGRSRALTSTRRTTSRRTRRGSTRCRSSGSSGPGVVVDATDVGRRGRITWEHVEPVADRLGPGTIVLLHTGWARARTATPDYFAHPFLDADACRQAARPRRPHVLPRRDQPRRDPGRRPPRRGLPRAPPHRATSAG